MIFLEILKQSFCFIMSKDTLLILSIIEACLFIEFF